MIHPIYLHIAWLDGERKLAFVLRIQSFPRNLRIWSKVARAERMCVTSRVIFTSADARTPGVSMSHARTRVSSLHACGSSNAKVSHSSYFYVRIRHRCCASKALDMFSTDIFHKVARSAHLCKWNIFWRTSFHSFILSPLCTLVILHLNLPRRNRQSNVMIRFSPLRWILRRA